MKGCKDTFSVGGEVLEQTGRYKYLGAAISQGGRCVVEIKTIVAIAKNACTSKLYSTYA